MLGSVQGRADRVAAHVPAAGLLDYDGVASVRTLRRCWRGRVGGTVVGGNVPGGGGGWCPRLVCGACVGSGMGPRTLAVSLVSAGFAARHRRPTLLLRGTGRLRSTQPGPLWQTMLTGAFIVEFGAAYNTWLGWSNAGALNTPSLQLGLFANPCCTKSAESAVLAAPSRACSVTVALPRGGPGSVHMALLLQGCSPWTRSAPSRSQR